MWFSDNRFPAPWTANMYFIPGFIVIVIWLYQLSWKCKLATVTSYKADVSSVSPSSELYNLPPQTQHHSFFRNFHPLFTVISQSKDLSAHAFWTPANQFQVVVLVHVLVDRSQSISTHNSVLVWLKHLFPLPPSTFISHFQGLPFLGVALYIGAYILSACFTTSHRHVFSTKKKLSCNIFKVVANKWFWR